MSKQRTYPQQSASKAAVQPATEVKEPATDDQLNESANTADLNQESSSEVNQENSAPEQEKATEPEVAQVNEPAVQKPTTQAKQPTQSTKESKPVYKVELDLTTYVEAMNPAKPIDPTEGGKSQHFLFTILRNVLNAKDQDTFNKEWSTVLGFINKDTTKTFSEGFVFRFPEQWSGSQREYTTFRRLLYTVLHTADPKTRKKHIADINLESVTENMTEAQRTYVLNYYG